MVGIAPSIIAPTNAAIRSIPCGRMRITVSPHTTPCARSPTACARARAVNSPKVTWLSASPLHMVTNTRSPGASARPDSKVAPLEGEVDKGHLLLAPDGEEHDQGGVIRGRREPQ